MKDLNINNFHILLYKPQIPHNTGNIIRLCANNGAQLHIVEPMGFKLDNAHLKRASLDYTDLTSTTLHDSIHSYIEEFPERRIFAATSATSNIYTNPKYTWNDSFLFGPEDKGLPDKVLNIFPEEQHIGIPMFPNNRSLNLSNAVAITSYEAWRQLGFSKK
ncbi:MAG: tRNA (cytidine(34)-2'-O)-methyltransferase [SAR202 cluster bacterium]|nr:tRNA (cytidine(34)-2'-O)-methyltransferase [SAR202 cluster bacterium]